MINSIRHRYQEASTAERAFYVLSAASLVALGFTATANSQDPNRIPGSIHCEGLREVTAKDGDTFSELIDDNVETNMGPADFEHFVDGVSKQHRKGMTTSFMILPGEIAVAPVEISADMTYQLPIECEKVFIDE